MKKTLLSAVALLGFTAGAMAADLPQPVPPMAPVPLFTWTGFYVGVNVGYAFSGDEDDDIDDFFDDDGLSTVRVFPNSIVNSPGTDATLVFGESGRDFFGRRGSSDGDGFVGGAQIGFNYQLTPGSGLVIGLEADIQFADLGGDDDLGDRTFGGLYTVAPPPIPVVLGAAFSDPRGLPTIVTNSGAVSGIDWFGTIRGRLGFAVDRVLFYGTGGLAFAEGGGFQAGFCDRFGDCDGGDDWRWGYAVGAGIEWAWTNNITLKIEGLYVNLEGDDDDGRIDRGRALYDAGTNTLFVRDASVPGSADDFFIIRGGLNFKFGGPY